MRFIHTADWHIGKPFAWIEDEEKRFLCRSARLDTIKEIGRLAREEDASMVIVAGDVFDSNTPKNSTVSRLCHAIGQLGLPVIVIPGNHDVGGPGSIWQQPFFQRESKNLAPNLTVVLEPGPVVLDDCVILACPCVQGAHFADPVEWLSGKEVFKDLPKHLPRVVLAHGSVQDFQASNLERQEGSSQFHSVDLGFVPYSQVDYIALGDWHGTKQIDDKAWYSGTHEPDRFPRGQDYRSGNVLVVDVSRDKSPTVEAAPVNCLRWHRLEHVFSSSLDLKYLIQRIEELTKGDVAKDLLRLELSGSLGIDAARRLEELVEGWKAKFLSLEIINNIDLAPDEDEVTSLTNRPDPLISEVASHLLELIENPSPSQDRRVAQQALKELYLACHRLSDR